MALIDPHSASDSLARPRTAPEPAATTVLVTGATGRIGRVLVEDLVERGYRVRATTSKALNQGQVAGGTVEWRRFDFTADGDFDGLIAGCDAVLHLAAEIGKMELMERVNAEATKRLAEAAERSGVASFCYVSTVAVYGNGLQRDMLEDGPVLTTDVDVRSEAWALDYVRAYGRTKLVGELAIKQLARTLPYAILRPTVVVSVDDLIGLRDWSFSKRVFAAHRHAHHIYVRDVTHAAIWCMQQALAGAWRPGSVQVFNLSEDEFVTPRHIDFMRKAFRASGDKRFRVPLLPGLFDWLHDFSRFRTLPLRNPLWRMRFPNDRLKAAGYRHRYGMSEAHRLALEALERERRR